MLDFAFPRFAALRCYCNDYDQALQNAALLLGGSPALGRTQAVIESVRSEHEATRRMIIELRDLHALLTLQRVHDIDGDEAFYFSCIDPADPVVEDICLLADGLGTAIDAALDEWCHAGTSRRSRSLDRFALPDADSSSKEITR